MNTKRRVQVSRALIVLCAGALAWAGAIMMTGGFVAWLGPVRVSSRSPRTALFIVLLSFLGLLAASPSLISRSLRAAWLAARRFGATSAATIALVGIALDLYQWAGNLPLWLDEESIALNVRDRSFAELAGPLWLGQSAPLGWLAAERAATVAMGTSELVLRFVPVVFGIATVLAALWVGRRWMGGVGAAVLVLLCWISPSLSHFRFEVKPYSADTFWGLLLPALAVWATEGDEPGNRARRIVIWWAVAAIGLWFANGALLVTPASAILLLVVVWRRHGPRAGMAVAVVGLLWLASFGLHYQLSLRHTHQSEYLHTYWAAALPPASAGPGDRLRWLVVQLEPLARDPGSTGLWVSLWVSAVCGFLVSRRPTLGAAFGLVPLSAFVLAGVGLVPLTQRLAIWIVPALYVGVALVLDTVVRTATEAYQRRRWARLACAAMVMGVGLQLCADVFERGRADLEIPHPPDIKHALDDRSAVRWLIRHRQPGDALLTTRLAWPALWWYGEIDIGDAAAIRSRHVDGGAMFEMSHVPAGSDCDGEALREALKGHRRALVYLGFRDVPQGFEDLLIADLLQIGAIAAFKRFSEDSLALVLDLRSTSRRSVSRPWRAGNEGVLLEGCVSAHPVQRW